MRDIKQTWRAESNAQKAMVERSEVKNVLEVLGIHKSIILKLILIK